MPETPPETPGQRFAQELGIELIEASEGCASARLELTERHHNSFGTDSRKFI